MKRNSILFGDNTELTFKEIQKKLQKQEDSDGDSCFHIGGNHFHRKSVLYDRMFPYRFTITLKTWKNNDIYNEDDYYDDQQGKGRTFCRAILDLRNTKLLKEPLHRIR